MSQIIHTMLIFQTKMWFMLRWFIMISGSDFLVSLKDVQIQYCVGSFTDTHYLSPLTHCTWWIVVITSYFSRVRPQSLGRANPEPINLRQWITDCLGLIFNWPWSCSGPLVTHARRRCADFGKKHTQLFRSLMISPVGSAPLSKPGPCSIHGISMDIENRQWSTWNSNNLSNSPLTTGQLWWSQLLDNSPVISCKYWWYWVIIIDGGVVKIGHPTNGWLIIKND